MVNPRTLIFHISGLSSTPSLHYVLPNWPVDLLIHGQPTDIDLPYQWSVLNPFPTLCTPHLTNGSSYPWSTHGHWSSISVVCPQSLRYITSFPTDQWIFLSMVNPRTHWSSISAVCPQPLPYICPSQLNLLIHGQPTDSLIFHISGLSSTPSLHMSFPTDRWIFLSMVNSWTHWNCYG